MASDMSNLVRGDSYRMATTGRSVQNKSLTRPQKENMNDLKQELDIDSHRVPIDDLFYQLGTDPDVGLTNDEARRRLTEYGKNILSPVHATPAWVIFSKNLFGGFSLLLWIGGILCFIAYGIQAGAYANPPIDNLLVGIVLIVIVLLSASFTFFQETKSTKIMESFERLVPYKANVIRNGFTYDILSEDLVVGDIINVKCGDRIPADLRIITANAFKVDNSALTGEFEAQVRSAEYTNENSLETKNLAFFSTNAVEGSCKGVIIHTGDATVMGRIANLASGVEASLTPIAKEINFFINVITVLSVILAVLFLIAAFLYGYYWIDSIIYLIAIIIACVPEGLLATVTVCLTLTAKRMSKKNCLVKHLEAVETLGCTKVICCDKTGTLTQNKMTVSHVWFDNYLMELELADNELLNGFDTDLQTWKPLNRAIMLCNHAEFLPMAEGEGVPIMQKSCSGDASEAALLRFMEVVHGNVEDYKNQNKKVFEVPFNSQNKYQLSVHETSDKDSEYLLVMKGAPEKILEYCDSVFLDGELSRINDDWQSSFLSNYERLGVMGERVIGFAEKRLSSDKFPKGFDFEEEEYKFPPGGMHFIGLVSMVDPPRAAVPEAVEKCRTAGIKVVMITGDHPVTAKAVAKAVGIISEGMKTVEDLAIERGVALVDVDPSDAKACVIHGNDLRDMTSDQLDKVLAHHDEIVFARTTPHQKLLIVEGFQRLGHIVSVTGDGVNDSPALKKADIGIAMGLSGSDVSKQAADMILLDDNFASIVTGIEEGRVIFDNLKKSICYTLTSNIPEISPLLLFIVAGIPLPLGTIAVLLIDLGTDILPAVSLAYEKAETDNMKRDPRNPKIDKLITHNLLARAFGQIGIIETCAGFFTYFIIMAECGFWPLRLLGLRQEWDSLAINDVMDSYGQEWSYTQRKELEYTASAGFFAAIVMTQWANLIICKTKRNSVFEEGLMNHYLTVSLFISATLAIIFIYVPGLDFALRLQPLRFTWWLPSVPFILMILLYDEIRKFIVRNGLKTWKRETF